MKHESRTLRSKLNSMKRHSPSPLAHVWLYNSLPLSSTTFHRLITTLAGGWLTVGLIACALLVGPVAAAAAVWTPLANQPPVNIKLMLLVSDGTVMAGGGANAGNPGTNWVPSPPNHHGRLVHRQW